MNLCNEVPVRIDRDVWEHAAPYIGCIMVVAREPGSVRTDAFVPSEAEKECKPQ